MDNIQKQMRKIRKDIREKAAMFRMTTDSYRELNGITTDEIRRQAEALVGAAVTSKPKASRAPTACHKPYDGISNKPQYDSLLIGKPIYCITHNGIYGFDFIVKLSANGHYLPIGKIHRHENGEAVKVN